MCVCVCACVWVCGHLGVRACKVSKAGSAAVESTVVPPSSTSLFDNPRRFSHHCRGSALGAFDLLLGLIQLEDECLQRTVLLAIL
jgi:hypothetical protein